jgi:hypothetical protein
MWSRLLSVGIARPEVYGCVAACAEFEPRLLRADLPVILEAMSGDLRNEQALTSVAESIALCVIELIRVFPIQLAGFAPALFDFFSSHLAAPQDTEDEDEDTPVNTGRGRAMVCCAAVLAAYPEQFAERLEPLLAGIHEWLRCNLVACNEAAADALRRLSPVLPKIGFDVSEILTCLLVFIEHSEPPPAEYFRTLGAVLRDSAHYLKSGIIERLGAFFSEVLKGEIEPICHPRDFLDRQFQEPVFLAIRDYVLSGIFHGESSNEFVSLLIEHGRNPEHSLIQSFAVATLARVCWISPDQTAELASELVSIASESLSTPGHCTSSAAKAYFVAFMYLLISHGQVFSAEHLAFIKASCEAQIEGASQGQRQIICTIWLLLLALFDLPAEADQVMHVLSSLSPETGFEGLPHLSCALSVLRAKFPDLLGSRLPFMASAIVASPARSPRWIDKEELDAWSQVLLEFSDDQILELVSFNETDLQAVLSRIR